MMFDDPLFYRNLVGRGLHRDLSNPQLPNVLKTMEELESIWKDSGSARFYNIYHSILKVPKVKLERLRSAELPSHHSSRKVMGVRMPGPYAEVGVFKSIDRSTFGWRRLYHELRQLLCMQPNKHVVNKPLAIVVDGDTDMVVGFVLPLLKGPTLEQMLDRPPGHPTLKLRRLQASWCRQTAEALHYFLYHGNGLDCPGYYSDLKPDNIILVDDAADPVLNQIRRVQLFNRKTDRG